MANMHDSQASARSANVGHVLIPLLNALINGALSEKGINVPSLMAACLKSVDDLLKEYPVEPASKARESLASIVNRVCRDRERVIILRNGKPAGAVVSMEDLQFMHLVETIADVASLTDESTQTLCPEDSDKYLSG